MTTMHHHIDEHDLQLLQAVQRLDRPVVSQLCEQMGVTATAVRQRLSRLQAMGCIERETVRRERGRPQHRYRLTDTGIRQLGDRSGELAALLWQEISQIKENDVRRELLGRIRSRLIAGFGQELGEGNLHERMHQLRNSLESRGLMAEIEDTEELGELPILREHSCPYQDLAAVDPAICEVEASVYAELLGAPVELSACRLDGHRCCEFQVGAPS